MRPSPLRVSYNYWDKSHIRNEISSSFFHVSHIMCWKFKSTHLSISEDIEHLGYMLCRAAVRKREDKVLKDVKIHVSNDTKMEFKRSLKEMTMMVKEGRRVGTVLEQCVRETGGRRAMRMKKLNNLLCFSAPYCSVRLEILQNKEENEEICWENKIPILSIELRKNSRVAFQPNFLLSFPIFSLFIIKTDQTTINLGFPILFLFSKAFSRSIVYAHCCVCCRCSQLPRVVDASQV